jgi:hypothetical protein
VIGDKNTLSDDLQLQGSIIKYAEVAKSTSEQNYKAVLEIHRNREARLQEYASGKVMGAMNID